MVVKWQNQSATVMLFSVSGSLWWEGAPLAPVCLGADSQWPYFLVRNQSNTQGSQAATSVSSVSLEPRIPGNGGKMV